MEKEIETLKTWIKESDNIVFFGGAGVSTESGIPDFRSTDGLYNEKWSDPPETIISHSYFMTYPEKFYDFYKQKMIYKDAKPGPAHTALAKLEAEGKLKAVITQNIDGLHSMAGSKEVYEIHGSILHNHCMRCHKYFSLSDIMSKEGVPMCDCGGIIKPDVVLYEEGLDSGLLNKSVLAIQNADVFIIGGTSLNVYPAAGLLDYYRGNKMVLINKSTTPKDSYADLVIHDSIGKVLAETVG